MTKRGRVEVVVEATPKRAFASAIEWPGWSRGARDEASALEALVAYGPRYRKALGAKATSLAVPDGIDDLEVVEHHKGDGSTEFGVPGQPARAEADPLSPAELRRRLGLLRGAWSAFDRTAKKAAGRGLAKGPRGGGRDLDRIVAHVVEAEGAYVYRLGARFTAEEKDDVATQARQVRRAVVEIIEARARGEEPEMGRRTAPLWSLGYGIRRSAWHALDHAWEIEDRLEPR
jgi:hypothetical protein